MTPLNKSVPAGAAGYASGEYSANLPEYIGGIATGPNGLYIAGQAEMIGPLGHRWSSYLGLRPANDTLHVGGSTDRRTVMEYDLSGHGQYVADPGSLGRVDLALDLTRTSLASTDPKQLTSVGSKAFFTVGGTADCTSPTAATPARCG